LQACKDFEKELEGSEYSCLLYPGRFILISGGMSHGGSPTDLFDTLNIINAMPKDVLEKTDFD